MKEDIGWIKVYRALLDDPAWTHSSSEQKTVMLTILMMVNHEPKKWFWNNQKFELEAGQTVTSLQSIVDKTGIKSKRVSIKNVRTSIKNLENLGFLANQPTKTGRILTVLNWGMYQGSETEGGKGKGKQGANRGQTGGT